MLRRGIAAAKAGQRDLARDLLMRVVEEDDGNAPAWLWLSSVMNSLEDREVCLENVLTLEPDNALARRGLTWIRRQKEQRAPPPAEATPPASPATGSPAMRRARTPISPAAAILAKISDAAFQPVGPEPRSPPSSPSVQDAPQADVVGHQPSVSAAPAPQDAFGNEFLCPYCARQTQPEDKACAHCGGDLWVRSRRREKRSVFLWVVLASQFFGTFVLAIGPPLALLYVGLRALGLTGLPDLADPLALAGFSESLPAPSEIVRAALVVVPIHIWALSALPCLLSAAVFVATYLRWKPVFYLLLADALLWLVAAVASMILARNLVSGVVGAVLALSKMLLIFQLEDDFAWERRRLLLRFDRGLSGGIDFLARGDLYAQRKMWGLAALHLRRAVGLLSKRVDARLALAATYIRLGQYDRADQVLAEARRISPGHPRVSELRELLNELCARDSSF